jgi:hypothetical protein
MAGFMEEGLKNIAQITSAKVCSVFLKYRRPDVIRTITPATLTASPDQ